MQNLELSANPSQLENLNEINLGLLCKSDFAFGKIKDCDKKLFLGKKVKVHQVPLAKEIYLNVNEIENQNSM